MRILAAIALLLPAACIISFGDWGPRVWVTAEEAFEADRADLAHVACTTHNGDVAVAGGDGDGIVVRVRKRAGGRDEEDAEAAMAAIEILHKRVDGGLALGWRWKEASASSWQANVAFDVSQPADLPVEIETHNGDVRVTQLTAKVVLRTHNGDLSLLHCAGKVNGLTHNGRIEADITSSDVDLQSHNGSMQVTLSGDGPVNGEIRTHNGGIELALAEARSTRLSANSGNGRVRSERPVRDAVIGRNSMVANLGAGAGRLAVSTHNGSIRIR